MHLVQPGSDEKFTAGLAAILTYANDNLAELGLTTADLAPVMSARADLGTGIANTIKTRAAFRAAVSSRAASRKSANNALGALQRRVLATPGVTSTQLEQMGLKVRAPYTAPKTPQTPANLVVNGTQDGTNSLRWKPNGNTYGTTYLIEARAGDARDFTYVSVSTRTAFEHTGQTPGVPITYRVKAQRTTMQSTYSNIATIYEAAPAQPAARDMPQLRIA